MAGKGEGHAYPAIVDRCFLVRRKIDHHGGAGLEMATDVGSEYHLHIPNR